MGLSVEIRKFELEAECSGDFNGVAPRFGVIGVMLLL